MALTTPLDLQQAHVLGSQNEQGQAEPTRETAAAASAYRCPHRCPATDCATLGGSGGRPTWSAEGASQTQTHCPCSPLSTHCSSSPPNLQACCHRGGLLHPNILGRRKKGGWTGQLWSLTKDQPNSDHPHPWPGHSHSSPSARSSPAAGKCKSGGLLPNHLRWERLRCMWLRSTRNFSLSLKVYQSYNSSWSGIFSSQCLY